MNKLKRLVFAVIGCVSLALGVVGIVLPVLPTVPFFLLTAFCFANSSERLHNWFLGTNMYKKYVATYVKKKGMTLRAKAVLLGTVSALMLVGFLMMKNVPVGRVILAIVWAGHVAYFGFRVRTLTPEEAAEAAKEASEDGK